MSIEIKKYSLEDEKKESSIENELPFEEGIATFSTLDALGEYLLLRVSKKRFDDGGGYSGNPSDRGGGYSYDPNFLARQWMNNHEFFHTNDAPAGEYHCKGSGKIIKISSPMP